MTSKSLILSIAFSAVCAALNVFGAPVAASDGDIFVKYDREIHGRVTGVYESGDYVFFHSREKIQDNGRFAKQKAARAAFGALTAKVFGWVDAHMDAAQPSASGCVAVMKTVGNSFCTPKSAVRRQLSDVPMRILYRDVDKKSPETYVLDMAFLRKDLLDEAARGRFEDRPAVVMRQWKNVVREHLTNTNRMSFASAVGAFDFWTIESCRTCGVRELLPTNGQESVCCRRCIADLSECVKPVGNKAAQEYVRMLSGMEGALSNELASASWFVSTNRLGVSILSFGSCLVERQDVPDDGWDLLATYGDQSKDPEKTCEALSSLLVRAPGSEELWRLLGVALLRGKRPHAAAACFRMALRIQSESAETMDALATAYEALGCTELAKGAAVMAFGLSKDGENITASKRILELK